MVSYLDHNATTPLDERVLEAMLPHLRESFGNPSSVHAPGRAARKALDQAREQVAALLGAHPSQVIFTSGGTEANNLAIKGLAFNRQPGRIALSTIEHASVRAPAKALIPFGWSLDEIEVDAQGLVQTEALAARLTGQTALVSVMLANNETGACQPLAELVEALAGSATVLHTDAVQAAGKLALDFTALGAHLMSVSAHKLNGPKGVGALVVDKALDLTPLLHGGGQEKGRRGGTENLAAIVGFGKAAELAATELNHRAANMRQLRERFEAQLKQKVPTAVVFAEQAPRLPNTTFLALPGIEGETLLMGLDSKGLAVSSGAACGSSHNEPSHVLKAMGVDAGLARCAIRVSFGLGNDLNDVDVLITALQEQAAQVTRFAATAWA